ncbi:Aldo/keto reductase [Sparassis latifolia]|uniref:D-arabinose 1-dehydrogenase n=1 Tax=Sparassis crispa TaxID=139825 RepID=A0A401GAL4_9APHY|nr:D-arabinose 1-dehydrogenase [Sparassis crispa]GBE79202.1 D-arabinose 1-dehydrogenase [Sparassis crispa]
MVVPLNSPQPVFSLPPLDEIPDTDEDTPKDGTPLGEVGSMHVPEIVLGAATFSYHYNSDEYVAGTMPLRTVRLALRYGIRAFDTAAYYGVSEIVLGTALKTLAPEFPRSSYKLMTKCGRYGPAQSEFDYTPATVRASVRRSLARLNTDYLDVVYLHDVEYVCTPVGPQEAGDHTAALADAREAEYGLARGAEGKTWGEGDQKILDALAELRKMQGEGLIRAVGITGYNLPTLLRLALLVLHTPPYKPLDVLLTYSNLNLQNASFASFAPALKARARIPQLLIASPLNMGLLTFTPPAWHPAPAGLRAATAEAVAVCDNAPWEGGLPNVAVGYGFRRGAAVGVPVVVGMTNLLEVHENVRVWRELKDGTRAEERVALEGRVVDVFREWQGWSWVSPPSQ